MSRRISIELTSSRPDGSWTWRAAGAREPRGVIDASLVPPGTKLADVLVAEVETDLDGTRVLSVAPPKGRTERSGLLEILPSERPFEAVTSQLVRKGDRRRTDGPARNGERRRTDGPGRNGDRRRDGAGRPGDDSRRRGDGDDRNDAQRRAGRPRFEAPPELPKRPKARRIKVARTHVDEVLAELPEAHRPIAERVLAGGVRAVRAAVDEQNARLASEGKPAIPADGLVTLAVQMKSRLFVAEWLDGAEAAMRILDDIDLRDLRPLVAKATDPMIAQAEGTSEMVARLKEALQRRQDEDTRNWFADIEAAVEVGRVVRALKLAGQPPKVGQLFPPEIAQRLSAATATALAEETRPDRWIAILEAAAFSPVCGAITVTAPPSAPSEDLVRTVTRLAPAMPQVAAVFGITVAPGAPKPRPLRPARPTRKPARPDAPRPAPVDA
jgi:hypothetical protein